MLHHMKVKTSVHGFRSSFRDWAGDMTHFQREHVEACLAHRVGNSVELACRLGISEQAIAFRFAEKTPSLNDMARLVSAASRLLRYENQEERIEVENATVLALAKKRQLVS